MKKIKRMDDTKDGLIEQVKFLKSVVQVLLIDLKNLEAIVNELQKKRSN
jgi:hypothetical protein